MESVFSHAVIVNITLSWSGLWLVLSRFKGSAANMGDLHLITKLGISLLVFPWWLFGLLNVMLYFSSYIPINILYESLKLYVYLVFSAKKIALWVFLASFSLLVIRLVYYRFLRTRLETFYNSKIRKRVNDNVKRPTDYSKSSYDVVAYLQKRHLLEKGIFQGIDAKTQKPIYISLDQKIQHTHCSGPTGSGKTQSILIPEAFQHSLLGHAIVIVDGKAETELRDFFYTALTDNEGQNFKVFNTLTYYDENDTGDKERAYTPKDIRAFSLSFNPLAQLDTPEGLTDMLTLSLEMESETDAKFYYDIQKAFLLKLFALFLATKRRFNFIDIVEFMYYKEAREYTYRLARSEGAKDKVRNMISFLSTLTSGYKELLGLRTNIEQLFVLDDTLSVLVNDYSSEIIIKDSLQSRDFLLFSVSTGSRYRSNRALARMIISILNALVGEKQGFQHKEMWAFFFEEVGQYATKVLGPLISTARSSNTAIMLLYQNFSQLSQCPGLRDIITSNTDTKFILRTLDDADFWAKNLGTVDSARHTYVIQEESFATETRADRGSIREVDEFYIPPNVLRNLKTGQSVLKYTSKNGGMEACVVNHQMLRLKKVEEYRIAERKKIQIEGLNLRKHRISDKEKKVPNPPQEQAKNVENKAPFSRQRRVRQVRK